MLHQFLGIDWNYFVFLWSVWI